ncbi:hypothetical protein R1sor_024788 [Riccia sorocarpa]|uniref:Reverse transcriptase domain-containing protein n=1 Tax=Riccia sorocarpa TaxID=122646 RepID=A0ABD3GUH7_9MARC
MALLQAAQIEGRVQEIEAGNGRQILEALFADDTGLLLQAEEDNWRRATEVMKQFERILGAKLNVLKSLAIPIGFTDPPSWLVNSGCKIMLSGEVFTYLGCPIGVALTEEQSLQYLLDKLTKVKSRLRLSHWTHRFLTWEGRLVLTKHILHAMPNYVLMIIGLTKDGYKELTKICRGFVLGSNSEGKEKKALVAWDIVCRRKEDGGVGLTSFELQANALKMRFVGKLLADADPDWVRVAKAILQWKMADTASRMLEGWCAAKRSLVLKDFLVPYLGPGRLNKRYESELNGAD